MRCKLACMSIFFTSGLYGECRNFSNYKNKFLLYGKK